MVRYAITSGCLIVLAITTSPAWLAWLPPFPINPIGDEQEITRLEDAETKVREFDQFLRDLQRDELAQKFNEDRVTSRLKDVSDQIRTEENRIARILEHIRAGTPIICHITRRRLSCIEIEAQYEFAEAKLEALYATHADLEAELRLITADIAKTRNAIAAGPAQLLRLEVALENLRLRQSLASETRRTALVNGVGLEDVRRNAEEAVRLAQHEWSAAYTTASRFRQIEFTNDEAPADRLARLEERISARLSPVTDNATIVQVAW